MTGFAGVGRGVFKFNELAWEAFACDVDEFSFFVVKGYGALGGIGS